MAKLKRTETIGASLVDKRQEEYEKSSERPLTACQERFCQLYALDRAFFGNGTQAYIEAYGIDVNVKGQYTVASAGAAENLTKPHILKRIRELMNTATLNDEFVDRELSFMIEQDADMSTKLGAIREYNKLRQRITEKIDITTSGEKIIGYKLPRIDDDVLPSKK